MAARSGPSPHPVKGASSPSPSRVNLHRIHRTHSQDNDGGTTLLLAVRTSVLPDCSCKPCACGTGFMRSRSPQACACHYRIIENAEALACEIGSVYSIFG